ncbi:MAG: hypothetical protein DSM106950_10560 [Stigonema ocellatum SAG 48.90 = DSM 106950]|nr:hypothetical protein [Stigonema ocellatum SAG 48.90 = DSM 106950]
MFDYSGYREVEQPFGQGRGQRAAMLKVWFNGQDRALMPFALPCPNQRLVVNDLDGVGIPIQIAFCLLPPAFCLLPFFNEIIRVLGLAIASVSCILGSS